MSFARPTLRERLEGGLSGLLVGDASGAASPVGLQALVLLESLLAAGRLDADDLAKRLGAGDPNEDGTDSGALVRMLPLALWHKGSDLDLVRDALEQSRVTHAHARSQLACALYGLWARRQIEATPDPWNDALYTLLGLTKQDPSARAELATHVAPPRTVQPTGTDSVVDSLHSARHALEQRTFEGVVKAAIALGNATEITACVAGGLAGIRHGVAAIPEKWREALNGRLAVDPLLQRLLAHRGVG